jgi:MFS family permease
MSLAFAIVGDMVPPRQRGRYQGYFMTVFATSSVLGPVLGGFFAGQSFILGIQGWRWIFYINVPVGIVALVVVRKVLARPGTRSDDRVDYLGAALLTAGVIPLLLLAEKGRAWGWGSPLSLSLLALGLAALALFVPRERKMGDEAILPLRMFGNRVFSVANVVAFLSGAAMFGGLTSLPLYLQIVRGESPTAAGLQLIPFMVGITGASLSAGRIMMHTGRYKMFPVVGTAVMAVAMLLFSTLKADTPILETMAFMVVMGIGLGLSMQTLVIAVQNSLPARDMGVATSSVTFFRSMGGTFGVAAALALLFGSLAGNIRHRALAAHLPPEIIARFKHASALNDTSIIAILPPAVRRAVLEGFADSMDLVFLSVFFLLVPAFLLSLFIKEVPLRAMGGLDAARAEAAQQQGPDAGGHGSAEPELDSAKSETAVL